MHEVHQYHCMVVVHSTAGSRHAPQHGQPAHSCLTLAEARTQQALTSLAKLAAKVVDILQRGVAPQLLAVPGGGGGRAASRLCTKQRQGRKPAVLAVGTAGTRTGAVILVRLTRGRPPHQRRRAWAWA